MPGERNEMREERRKVRGERNQQVIGERRSGSR
jgi:hypothetical protein